jgi:hypothetical protein
MRVEKRWRLTALMVLSALLVLGVQACSKKDDPRAQETLPGHARNASHPAASSSNRDCINAPDSVLSFLHLAKDERNVLKHDKLYRGTCVEVAGHFKAIEQLADTYCEQMNVPTKSYVMIIETPWAKGLILSFVFEKDRASALEHLSVGQTLRVRGHYYKNEYFDGWGRVVNFVDCDVLD